MMRTLRYGLSVIALSAALTAGGVGLNKAEAALTVDQMAALDALVAGSGTFENMLDNLYLWARANIGEYDESDLGEHLANRLSLAAATYFSELAPQAGQTPEDIVAERECETLALALGSVASASCLQLALVSDLQVDAVVQPAAGPGTIPTSIPGPVVYGENESPLLDQEQFNFYRETLVRRESAVSPDTRAELK